MDYKRIAEQTGPRVGATQEWIFQVLRNGIINGNLPGGTQLKQDEISSALNVSHIPVREALRRLEAQGLVKIHPNRGASVTSLTQQSILDMMQVRATLAVMMLKNSAPHLTEKDYDELY
ncbi:MAG: GntR family transcriptional regulator [Clostridia bacterium]|nr:GntR family transcriptional regulator [Clostridia bacterium]